MTRLPTLRQLGHLVALADHGHFGRAAEACGVTQSSLSASIKELEAILGTALVDRSGRRVALTPLGLGTSFSPANVVPGISHSPDKMLQFRIFSYADAHRYRLGVNYESLPVNKPRCPVHNYHRDGAMRFDGNDGGAVNYEPNSFGGPKEDHAFREPPLHDHGRCGPLRSPRRQ